MLHKTWKWTVNSTREYISITDDEVEEEKHDQPSSSIITGSSSAPSPNSQPLSSIITGSPSAPSPNSQVEVEDVVSNESRLQRIRTRPTWMQDYVISGVNQIDDQISHFALFSDHDPIAFHDAIKESKWQKAMDEEIEAIEKSNTWELTNLPKGQKSIGVKWVYKKKLNADGKVDKYKARLVVKGYKQEYEVDYKEVFAPVAGLDTIRLVISVAAQNLWSIYQFDVKLAFLHGELQEDVYVEQPLGYEKQGNENKVYKLKKALYGLKQPPRVWYSRIESYFIRAGFHKCPYEHTLFIKLADGEKMFVVCLYVDDLIFTGNDKVMIDAFKASMMTEFDMTDLDLM